MTKDELRKEATFTVEWESTPMIDRPLFVHAYITGAEPREKRIAELELKIKHLTEHLEPQAMTALFEQVEEEVKQEQRIKKLEKENAKLKEKYDICLRENTGLKIHSAYLEKKLAEAKEILRALLKHTYGQNLNTQNDFDLYLGRIKEAEQFLKEVSE